MKIELRKYQSEALSETKSRFDSGDKEVVLAASPSSGKTVIAMKLIQDYTDKKFLILTHGTNLLKNQWRDELSEKGIPASDVPGEERICYGLPQGKKHLRELGNVDVLVIDEAHEFTFAKTVQGLIASLKPKKILYLTGTPSKFILRKYKPIIIPAIDLIRDGFISDLYVGMVSTSAPLDRDSFNTDGDVLEKEHRKLEGTVEKDLDNLLGAMHQRLCETGAFKGSPQARKLAEWAPTLGKLHKTMIACRSVKQAEKVQGYFEKKGVSVISSNSIDDVNTLNIQKFIDDSSIRILVVVDRGILGFNMVDLVNVVDLTCSRNIDRIYQLYARVMRKNDKHAKKYFFKFSTEDLMLVSKFYMNAALQLMLPDFIGKYNGKNLDASKIILPKATKTRKSSSGVKGKSLKEKQWAVDEYFKSVVEAGAFLIDIHNKIGNSANEYAYVTFGQVLADLEGREFSRPIAKITEADLLVFNAAGILPEHCYAKE